MNRWNCDGIRWCGDGVFQLVNWSVCHLVGYVAAALVVESLVHTRKDDRLNCCHFRGSYWHGLGWMCWCLVRGTCSHGRSDSFRSAPRASFSSADQHNFSSSVPVRGACRVKALLDSECPSLCTVKRLIWRFSLRSRRGNRGSADLGSEEIKEKYFQFKNWFVFLIIEIYSD